MGRPLWTRLLADAGGCEMTLRGETVQLVPLPARALLSLEAEVQDAGASPFAAALRGSAALAAKCLRKDGKAVFSGAEEVLDTLTAEEINAVAARYQAWSRAWDASYESDQEEIAALKKV